MAEEKVFRFSEYIQRPDFDRNDFDHVRDLLVFTGYEEEGVLFEDLDEDSQRTALYYVYGFLHDQRNFQDEPNPKAVWPKH